MSSMQFFEMNRLCMISNCSDITLDPQVNFEVNNYMATNRDIIKLFDFSVAHVVMVFFENKAIGHNFGPLWHHPGPPYIMTIQKIFPLPLIFLKIFSFYSDYFCRNKWFILNRETKYRYSLFLTTLKDFKSFPQSFRQSSYVPTSHFPLFAHYPSHK